MELPDFVAIGAEVTCQERIQNYSHSTFLRKNLTQSNAFFCDRVDSHPLISIPWIHKYACIPISLSVGRTTSGDFWSAWISRVVQVYSVHTLDCRSTLPPQLTHKMARTLTFLCLRPPLKLFQLAILRQLHNNHHEQPLDSMYCFHHCSSGSFHLLLRKELKASVSTRA